MVYIVLSLLGVLATIVMKSQWSQKSQFIFIISVIISGLLIFLIGYLMFEQIGMIEKNAPSFWIKVPWIEIGLYFSMIGGMVSKYFYDWIGAGKGRPQKIYKWQLFKPMLVSPLVFGTIYSNMQEITSLVLLFVFAFQNGFFWQTILDGKMGTSLSN